MELYHGLQLDRYKTHNIDLVVDRIKVTEDTERLYNSCEDAMRQGKGTLMIYEYATGKSRYFSRNLMCPTAGISYDTPAPHTVSFNSPHGACPRGKGLGQMAGVDREKIITDASK